MIDKLSYDIQRDHLFPYLDGIDLVHLSLLCKTLHAAIDQSVWRQAYKNSFGSDLVSAFGQDWAHNYGERFYSQLYTWGAASNNRLGHQLPVPTEYMSQGVAGVNRPLRVDLNLRVRDVGFGGYSLNVLTLGGQVWRIGGREVYRYGLDQIKCLSSALPDYFVSLSSGREGDNVLAVTDTGKCWLFRKFEHFPLDLPPLITVAAGWDVEAAICHEVGIIHWKNPAGSSVAYTTVPNARFGVNSQLGAGQGFLVVLDETGRVHLVDVEENKLVRNILSEDEQAVKISVQFNRIAIICLSRRVLLGRWEDKRVEFEPVPRAEELDFVDIALGDWHTLGLTRQGFAYSWGCESQTCGSLGLGTVERLRELGLSESEDRYRTDRHIDTPQRISLDKVLHIAAGGWQSAAVTAKGATSATNQA